LERLYVLSSFRNPQTGRYEHTELFGRFGEQDSNQALWAWHQRVFADWLGFTLEQQFADLRLFLVELEQSGIASQTWTDPQAYMELLPVEAQAVDRTLFLADMSAHLDLELQCRPKRVPKTTIESDSRIAEIVRCTHEPFGAAGLNLKALSERLGVSQKYLGMLFRQAVGVPFHYFRRGVLMKNAAGLLRRREKTLKDAAALAGYSDTANFHRDFKRFVGITPIDYRRGYAPELILYDCSF
jgi:AraC-like DNA-binding protein